MHGVESRYRFLNIRHDSGHVSALALAISSAIAGVAALGGVVVAIVALASAQMAALTGAATIAVGAALLAHAFGGLYRTKRTFRYLHDRLDVVTAFGGLSAGLLAGSGAVVLGIAALAGVLPAYVLPAAAITLGAGAVLVAPAHHRLSWLAQRPVSRVDWAADRTIAGSGIALVLTGLAAIFLGTLALLRMGSPVVLAAAAAITVGAATAVAAGALTARYRTPLASREHAADHADGLIALLRARLTASRTGVALYQAAAAKLVGQLDAATIATLETFAEKELENVDFLEYQLHGLGADVHASNPVTTVESEATRGIEHILLSTDVTDPLPVLYALHAADLHDESGWKLLTQVAEEVANEELKHEIKVKYGDKAEQSRFIARTLERLTQHVLVRAPLEAGVQHA
jgi:hypothetical protein